jgi:hypothetical protein
MWRKNLGERQHPSTSCRFLSGRRPGLEAGLRDPELLDELFLLGEGARVAAQALGPRGPVERFFEMFRSLVSAHTPQET